VTEQRDFPSSKLRKAIWDRATRQLDLHWAGGSTTAYKPVPEEVFRRLCSAPNPATYWEDRIAEEYPKVRAMAVPGQGGQAPKDLRDLFGPEE
jgi:hypothetical protein